MNRTPSFTKWILMTLSLSIFYGCKQEASLSPLVTITINTNNIDSIDISSAKIIELENSKESFLYDIKDVVNINDTLYIYTRGKVVAFDSNGKHLFNVGAKGRGPREYLSIFSFFFADNKLNIYDIDNGRIVQYNTNGEYYQTKPVATGDAPSCHFITPCAAGKYIACNRYAGSDSKVPSFSYLDKNFNSIKTFGKPLESGFTLVKIFSSYKDETLYWEMLCDTIYSINEESIIPKYNVDFGANKITQQMRDQCKDLRELITLTNEPAYVDKIAALIQYIDEDDNYVSFCFSHNRSACLAIYNKKDKTTKSYRLTSTDGAFKQLPFLKLINGKLMTAAMRNDSQKENHVLVILDIL